METMTAPIPKKVEWSRAWRALKGLVADPERTDLVFELLEALSGPAFERDFARFAASAEGRRLLTERPSLLAALRDRDTLRRLPEGTLGRAYLRFMEEGGLTAEGLVEAEEMIERTRPPLDADREFYGDRLRDMHDLWHVLTGYGMDEAGEAANLAFTAAQLPSRGIVAIVLTAAVLGPWRPWLAWQRYLLRAWQRGRRASQLSRARYEELLARPLEEVRRELGVEPPEVAHPGGVVVARRGDLITAIG